MIFSFRPAIVSWMSAAALAAHDLDR